MLQNPCKILGHKKNMVYKIPLGEVNHIQPVAYYAISTYTSLNVPVNNISTLLPKRRRGEAGKKNGIDPTAPKVASSEANCNKNVTGSGPSP